MINDDNIKMINDDNIEAISLGQGDDLGKELLTDAQEFNIAIHESYQTQKFIINNYIILCVMLCAFYAVKQMNNKIKFREEQDRFVSLSVANKDHEGLNGQDSTSYQDLLSGIYKIYNMKFFTLTHRIGKIADAVIEYIRIF